MKKNTTVDKSTFTEKRKAINPVLVREADRLSIVSSFSPGRIIVLAAMITFLLLCSWRICQTSAVGIVWFVFPALLLFFVRALWIDLDAVSEVTIDLKSKEVTVRKRNPLRRLFLRAEWHFHVRDIQTIRKKKSMVRVPYNVWYLSAVLYDRKKTVLVVAREEGGLERITGVLNEMIYRSGGGKR
ncbi:hypothetical protein HHL17_25905 [Chitinophaga sp. G-6-1-13]|uniref:Uncharacterized protein n=1 Tax=Chitinophaga fulva TaxID=2728842 RepID=A0A848GYE4_9BACT|nr:hypothetical protein [Chitinophaga fulva]NML40658.1 hypothetical protein [Chitinophaga fulva]